MNPDRAIEVLVVEDNPGDVRLMREALKEARLAHTLTVYGNGTEALDRLFRPDLPRPDLILLDLNLPGMDGREVLRRVKSDERLRRIPLVVLTSSDAEEDVARAYHLHANCYITKPVDFDQFIRVIRSIEDFWLNLARLPAG